ncbi:uncharacterized protein LOC141904413 [Tubulanus polymorphus]|uniref:uncharacterized protein LOC141904413 n=1 Tax=Tubulanus polymorphus TaxID=672921 RepID=UPI003DA2BD10
MDKHVKFDKDSTVLSLKATLSKNVAVETVEFEDCEKLTDTDISFSCHLLNPKLKNLIMNRVTFTERGLDEIVNNCKFIKSLKFINCHDIDLNVIPSIAKRLKKLSQLTFVRTNSVGVGTSRKRSAGNEEILNVIVRSCIEELHSLALVGFPEINDMAVNYVTECYGDLSEVIFNECPLITDQSMVSLTTSCRVLRKLGFSGADLTDVGVCLIADRCPRLIHADFSYCKRITDHCVTSLAQKCSLLERVNFSGCPRLTDKSLASLIRFCLQLETVNFSKTNIKIIPRDIVCLSRLKELNIADCPLLVKPSPDIAQLDTDSLLDYYKPFCLNYRLKVFMMGDSESGKTSLIESITTGTTKLHNSPTEGVDVTCWYPFREGGVAVPEVEVCGARKNLRLEFWDLSGRQLTQGAHQIYMTRDILFVIVCDVTDQVSCDNILLCVNSIQAKVPGGIIIVVSSRRNKCTDENEIKEIHRNIQKQLTNMETNQVSAISDEIEYLKSLQLNPNIDNRIDNLQYLLYKRPIFHHEILSVDLITGKGLDKLAEVLVNLSLDVQLFPHIVNQVDSSTVELYSELLKLKHSGCVLLTGAQIRDIAFTASCITNEDLFENQLRFLQNAGAILDIRFNMFPDGLYNHFVCLDPSALANSICLLLIDDDKKSFKFESRRFWPPGGSVSKPNPSVLVRALEDIPLRGVVREILFPLLWQTIPFNEDQIQLMMKLLCRLGILMPYIQNKPIDNGLSLSLFPNLSSTTQYYITLMRLLPNQTPQLNWTPKPFPGDLQITWRLVFPVGIPPGCFERLIGCIHTSRACESYQYTWKRGMLLKIAEAIICIQCEDTLYIDVSCRMNADSEDSGSNRRLNAVSDVWAHLSFFIQLIDKILFEWRGLYTKVNLISYGDVFYEEDDVTDEPAIDLYKCLEGLPILNASTDPAINVNLDFLIPDEVYEVPSLIHWLRKLNIRRENLLFAINDDNLSDETPGTKSNHQQPSEEENSGSEKPRKKKKKNANIKWKLDDSESGIIFTPHHSPEGNTINHPLPQPVTMDQSTTPQSITSDDRLTASTDTVIRNHSEQEREVSRMASGFVAAILAQSVADLIEEEYKCSEQKSDSIQSVINSAQVTAAKVTADAAAATQSGDIDGAAKAVLGAVRSVDVAVRKVGRAQAIVKGSRCLPNSITNSCTCNIM